MDSHSYAWTLFRMRGKMYRIPNLQYRIILCLKQIKSTKSLTQVKQVKQGVSSVVGLADEQKKTAQNTLSKILKQYGLIE